MTTEPPQDGPARAFAELRGPAPADAFWIEASWSQELPVPVHQVWALISAPSRRTEWDRSTEAVTVTADGSEQLTRGNGAVRTQHVVQFEPDRAIAWRRRAPDTDTDTDSAEATEVLQLVLEPRGGNTYVQLRHSSPGRGRGVRLSRPLLARMLRAQLRLQAEAIAQAA